MSVNCCCYVYRACCCCCSGSAAPPSSPSFLSTGLAPPNILVWASSLATWLTGSFIVLGNNFNLGRAAASSKRISIVLDVKECFQINLFNSTCCWFFELFVLSVASSTMSATSSMASPLSVTVSPVSPHAKVVLISTSVVSAASPISSSTSTSSSIIAS